MNLHYMKVRRPRKNKKFSLAQYFIIKLYSMYSYVSFTPIISTLNGVVFSLSSLWLKWQKHIPHYIFCIYTYMRFAVCVMESVKCLDMSVCRLSYHRHKNIYKNVYQLSLAHTELYILSTEQTAPHIHRSFSCFFFVLPIPKKKKTKKSVDGMRSVVGLMLYSCLCFYRHYPIWFMYSETHCIKQHEQRLILQRDISTQNWNICAHHTNARRTEK